MSILCASNVLEEKEKNDKDNMFGGEKEEKRKEKKRKTYGWEGRYKIMNKKS